jgi:chorismate mutase
MGESIMEHAVLEQALQALHEADERILQLLRIRQYLARQLVQTSAPHGHAPSLEERVSAVVGRLMRGYSGPLDQQRLASIFETVIKATEPLSIGLPPRNGGAKKG